MRQTLVIAEKINQLMCLKKNMYRTQVLSNAQYSAWLAAKLLNLPICLKVHVRGELLVYVQCKERNVTFEAEITQFGPQSKSRISRSKGFELIRFNPCFWTTGFVNFNGQSYVYANNASVPRRAHAIPQNRDSDLIFKYTDDNSFKLNTQSTPIYHTSAIKHANVVNAAQPFLYGKSLARKTRNLSPRADYLAWN